MTSDSESALSSVSTPRPAFDKTFAFQSLFSALRGDGNKYSKSRSSKRNAPKNGSIVQRFRDWHSLSLGPLRFFQLCSQEIKLRKLQRFVFSLWWSIVSYPPASPTWDDEELPSIWGIKNLRRFRMRNEEADNQEVIFSERDFSLDMTSRHNHQQPRQLRPNSKRTTTLSERMLVRDYLMQGSNRQLEWLGRCSIQTRGQGRTLHKGWMLRTCCAREKLATLLVSDPKLRVLKVNGSIQAADDALKRGSLSEACHFLNLSWSSQKQKSLETQTLRQGMGKNDEVDVTNEDLDRDIVSLESEVSNAWEAYRNSTDLLAGRTALDRIQHGTLRLRALMAKRRLQVNAPAWQGTRAFDGECAARLIQKNYRIHVANYQNTVQEVITAVPSAIHIQLADSPVAETHTRSPEAVVKAVFELGVAASPLLDPLHNAFAGPESAMQVKYWAMVRKLLEMRDTLVKTEILLRTVDNSLRDAMKEWTAARYQEAKQHFENAKVQIKAVEMLRGSCKYRQGCEKILVLEQPRQNSIDRLQPCIERFADQDQAAPGWPAASVGILEDEILGQLQAKDDLLFQNEQSIIINQVDTPETEQSARIFSQIIIFETPPSVFSGTS